jgi:glyoxylase-like metal-dependent hydrolase (beta-lactamase superfamily II)
MLKIKKFVVNPLGENSFVLYDETGECIFTDPGFYYSDEHDEVRDFIADNGLTPVNVVNTHCHFDHIMGVEFVRNEFGIPFAAHKDDVFWVEKVVDQGRMFGFELNPVNPVDSFLAETETVKFGTTELQVIHVPGHSPGHVCFYNRQAGLLVAGDVLFYGSIGRTDLPGGDYQTLISNIRNKLFPLPDETVVYCGHGPETTLGFEKRTNPFLI